FRHLLISGFTVRGSGQGIKLEKCLDATVERCTFDQAMRGLVAEGVEGLRVESCVFSRCILGLVVSASADARIVNNTFVASTSNGLLALNCGKGVIRNCIFAGNNSNYAVDALSGIAWSSDYNAIQGSTGPWRTGPSAN